MKIKLQLSIAFLFHLIFAQAQEKWLMFNASDKVSYIHASGERIWINSASGLSVVKTATEGVTIYNSFNSPIFYHTPQILTTDNNGWVWLEGDSCIMRFNGITLEIIEEVAGLPVIDVTAAKNGPDGKIWLLGSFGDEELITWENGIFTPVPPPDMMRYFGATGDLVVDTEGHAWTILRDSFLLPNYLYEFDGVEWIYHDLTLYNTDAAHKNTYLTDYSGNVYCYLSNPVDSNLIRWDGTQWIKMNIPLSQIITPYFHIDQENNFWVMSVNAPLLKWDGENWEAISLQDFGLPEGRPNDMEVDAQGKLWLVYQPYYTTGLSTSLYVQEGNEFKIIDLSNSDLHSNHVNSIALDAMQRKWLNTDDHLQTFDGTNWMHYGKPDFTTSFGGLHVSGEGKVWSRYLSAFSSILHFDGTTFEKIEISDENGIAYDDIWDLTLDEQGRPLLAVNESLVIRLNEDGVEYFDSILYTVFPGWFIEDKINEVASGKDGVIWALGDYLHKYDGEWEVVPFWEDDYFATHDLFVDESGNVYLNHGYPMDTLHRFDGNEWSMLALPEHSRQIRFDSKNNLWFNGLSLWKYDNAGNWTKFDATNSPLPISYISDFEIDAFDNLWLATSKGLIVYNENGIENTGTISQIDQTEKQPDVLSIYPNPARANFTLTSKKPFDKYHIRIMDGMGRCIMNREGWAENSLSIQIGDTFSGLYFIQVITRNWSAGTTVLIE